MSTLLAYRMHPALTRDAFLAEVEAHQCDDRLVQGQYFDWEFDPNRWNACAIGCAVHTINNKTGQRFEHHDLGALELVGIPAGVAELEDAVFEGLPFKLARDWPLRFATAIQDGADLTGVYEMFVLRAITDLGLKSDGTNPRHRYLVKRLWDWTYTQETVIKAWEYIADLLVEVIAAAPVPSQEAVA